MAAMRSVRNTEAANLDQREEATAERRIEVERRQFFYSEYIPERRSGRKRRKVDEPAKSLDGRTVQDEDE
jgi:hypothetical protein